MQHASPAPSELVFQSTASLRTACDDLAFRSQASRSTTFRARFRKHAAHSLAWLALVCMLCGFAQPVLFLLTLVLVWLVFALLGGNDRLALDGLRWTRSVANVQLASRLAEVIEPILGHDFELRISNEPLAHQQSVLSKSYVDGHDETLYRVDWLTLRGRLPGGLLLSACLRDQLRVEEYSGDENTGSWREDYPAHQVRIALFSPVPMDSRFPVLRQRLRDFPIPLACCRAGVLRKDLPEGFRSGVEIVLSQPGGAQVEAFEAGLAWLGRFIDLLASEPGSPRCPCCSDRLEQGRCQSCSGVWLDREQLSWHTRFVPVQGPTFGERPCPGCGCRLQVRELLGRSVEGCEGCGGYWVGCRAELALAAV